MNSSQPSAIPPDCLLAPSEAAYVTGEPVEVLTARHSIFMVGMQPRFKARDILGLPEIAAGEVPHEVQEHLA